ncbi:MAG: hypothetical protein P0120_11185 [Nitrospira sp.]|nr:hypothetical protein [Nitrospira sp.]
MLIARVRVACPAALERADQSFIEQFVFAQYGGDEGVRHGLPLLNLFGRPDDNILSGKHPTEYRGNKGIRPLTSILKRLLESDQTRELRADLVNRIRNILTALIVAEDMRMLSGKCASRLAGASALGRP